MLLISLLHIMVYVCYMELHVTLRVHVTFNYLLTLHGFTCECCLLLLM